MGYELYFTKYVCSATLLLHVYCFQNNTIKAEYWSLSPFSEVRILIFNIYSTCIAIPFEYIVLIHFKTSNEITIHYYSQIFRSLIHSTALSYTTHESLTRLVFTLVVWTHSSLKFFQMLLLKSNSTANLSIKEVSFPLRSVIESICNKLTWLLQRALYSSVIIFAMHRNEQGIHLIKNHYHLVFPLFLWVMKPSNGTYDKFCGNAAIWQGFIQFLTYSRMGLSLL